MTEKSPIDLLTEIHQMLTLLSARMDLLEQNMHLLHDKANGKLFPDARVSPSQTLLSQKTKNEGLSVVDTLAAEQKTVGVALPKSNGTTKVFGKVFGPDKKAINAASVIIKNQNHDVMHKLKTGPDGAWDAMLPPGKYAITYSKVGMSSMYRFVNVKSEHNELEVT